MENKVKQYRIDKGKTLEWVANQTGSGKSTIHGIESGAAPNVYLALKIAKALKVSVTKLFPIDNKLSVKHNEQNKGL